MKREFTRSERARPAPVVQPEIAPATPAPLARASQQTSDPVPGQAEATTAAPVTHGHGLGGFSLESRDAVQEMSTATGGAPLEGGLRDRLEGALRSDLSGVRVHRGPAAERATSGVSAPAVTMGRNIFLGPMAPAREVPVLAHEAVHVAQQEGGTVTAAEPRLGSRSDPEEHEAARTAASMLRGASSIPSISRGRSGAVARRFGAGEFGHGGIEADAAAAGGPPISDPTRDKGVKEMYSGNFMRDMNQLNVPLVMNTLSGLPKSVNDPLGEKVGTKGAHDITTAVIEAMAILELGPEVAHSLVTGGETRPVSENNATPAGATAATETTPDKIGVYRPEEHIDNPMGMSAKGDLLVNNTDPSKKDEHQTSVAVGAPRPAENVVSEVKPGAVTNPADADRDAQIKGSAVAGPQVENAELYKISGTGMQNHIYNSVEATKKRWLTAAQLGPTPVGRSEFGAGSHAVEDYFSHSNFVEVSLNSFIGEALTTKKGEDPVATKFAQTVVDQNNKSKNAELTKQGYYVDTMFDATVPVGPGKTKKRQAITTGTFGGTDTKVSLAHILLPQLPKLQKAIVGSVDQLFGIAAGPGGDGGWDHLKKFVSSEPGGAATARILDGFTSAGMTVSVPDIELEFQQVPLSPAAVAASAVGADKVASALSAQVPIGVKHQSKSMSITDAVGAAGGLYHRATKMVELVRQYETAAKLLVPFPIIPIIDAINAAVTKADQQVRREVKSMVVAGLVSIVDAISQRTPEQKAAAKAKHKPGESEGDAVFEQDLGDALEYLHEGVEAMEATTSLESRLKSGDLSKLPQAEVESRVGPVTKVDDEVIEDPVTKQKKTVRSHYVSSKPLPPSHSEISKDHEPHDEHPSELNRHHDPQDKEGLEKGSPFFGLARALAVEAVKHSDAQLQAVWSRKQGVGDTSLFGDGQKYEYKSGDDPANSASVHGKVMDEAANRAKAEQERAAKEGAAHMGSKPESPEGQAMKDPEVFKLVSLVDQFISHPDDTQWWRPVVTAYVKSNSQSVYDSILRRNKSRTERK